ncbi:MAG TPA: NHL repeat-containing protein [Candidatus Polarisedimenticolia bacterium]|nr:NHL repeat-containing protein [Candidatus Polarisedimenticolia bacterium]
MIRLWLLPAIVLLSTGSSKVLHVETVAGGGPDGIPALSANIFEPVAVAVLPDGDLLVASRGHDRIYRVDEDGILTVFAGASHRWCCNDGGPAARAYFHGVHDVVVSPGGEAVYVVDGGLTVFVEDSPLLGVEGNRRIRRIDTATGIISTVAGGGGGPTPATQWSFRRPVAADVDALGNLYVLDASVEFTFHAQVVRVDPASGSLTVLAGGASAEFSSPDDMAVDPEGNVYIADDSSLRVRRLDAVTGIITTVAGGGNMTGDGIHALEARLLPRAVSFDLAGDLLIADGFTGAMRRLDLSTGILTTDPPGLFGRVAFDRAGNLYAADQAGHRVCRRQAATGDVAVVAGSGEGGAGGDGGPAVAGSLFQPSDVAFDAAGRLVIADKGNARFRRVSSAGVIETLPISGTTSMMREADNLLVAENGDLFFSSRITRPADPSHIVYRRDASSGEIRAAVGGGRSWEDGVTATDALLETPAGIAFDSHGNLHIAEEWRGLIRKVDSRTQLISTVAGIWGVWTRSPDGSPAAGSSIGRPKRLAFDAADNLYFLDGLYVRKIDAATGLLTTVAGNGSFLPAGGDGGLATQAPLGSVADIAIDATGSVLLLGRTRLRRVDAATGIIDTIAGSDLFGFGGDGGPAIDAPLTGEGIAVAPDGSIHVAATHSNRIRRLAVCLGRDETPPILSVSVSPAVLPVVSGRLYTIVATVAAEDACGDARVSLVSITSSEPDDAPGQDDGHSTRDIQEADFGTADFEFLLRGERSRTGDGRTYTIVYSAVDQTGNEALASATVRVSHRPGQLRPSSPVEP